MARRGDRTVLLLHRGQLQLLTSCRAQHLADGSRDLPLDALLAQLAAACEVVEVGVRLHPGQRFKLRTAEQRDLEIDRLVCRWYGPASVVQAPFGVQMGTVAIGRNGGQVARIAVFRRRKDRKDRLAADGQCSSLGLLATGVSS